MVHTVGIHEVWSRVAGADDFTCVWGPSWANIVLAIVGQVRKPGAASVYLEDLVSARSSAEFVSAASLFPSETNPASKSSVGLRFFRPWKPHVLPQYRRCSQRTARTRVRRRSSRRSGTRRGRKRLRSRGSASLPCPRRWMYTSRARRSAGQVYLGTYRTHTILSPVQDQSRLEG